MFWPDQAQMFRCESSLMSTTSDRCAVFRSLFNKICPSTHLHKEEAWHDVSAGLLQAAVVRKAPHRPPLC